MATIALGNGGLSAPKRRAIKQITPDSIARTSNNAEISKQTNISGGATWDNEKNSI
jgi:hypothetical protein